MKRHTIALMTILTLLIPALPAEAHEAGQWIYRFGLGSVQPDDRNLVLDETTYVAAEGGSSVTLNATYFFSPHFAFDILAAFPFDHDIDIVAGLAETKLAETSHLPPTFSLQYHFFPEGKFQPYIGVGANWTTFFNTNTVEELADLGVDLKLDDSFGVAAQIGADVLVGDDWVLNVDFRNIDIETDAELGGAEIGAVKIDPWVYSVNFGYKF